MRYYEVKIERCVNHDTYIVRALNVPEANDKALKMEEQASADWQKQSGEKIDPAFLPRVKSVREFCDDSAVLL